MDGRDAEIDVESRTPRNFDLMRDLLEYRIEVLAKTDWAPRYFNDDHAHKSYLYNQLSGRLVENCEYRASAQPVKNCFITTSETILCACEIPVEDDRSEVVWWDLPTTWGRLLPWFHLGLKESRGMTLEITPLSADDPPSSSID